LEGDFGELPKHLESPMKTVFHSCESLANIVEDFLNISRIEQNRMKYELSEFAVGDILGQVLEELKPTFAQKGLTVEKMIDDGIMVKADKGKIKQIINNIIDNSIKYTPKGGISVRLEKNDGNALITVKDTGIGINPKTIPKLFQKFSRAEDAAKANIMGTGLGLYVASQMIKAQGGHIWVESEGDGKGSTFFIELKAIN
jgi:signal transduction histidine kinase